MKKAVESAAENLRVNRNYYKSGTISVSDLLEAETFVQQNKDGYTKTCTTYYDVLTEYLQVTGRQ